MNAPEIDTSSPAAVRRAIRDGRFKAFTADVAPGFAQGNLFIVPGQWADDFARFCERNSQALPVLGRSEPGSPHIPSLGADLDLRTDVGEYMVFRDGELVATPTTIADLWQDDFVAFVLGCSFSFEEVLKAQGLRLRHQEEGDVSAMYVTSRPTEPVGPFHGPLVVSMRPMEPADAIAAISICARYPQFHGAPIHIGHPEMIGIDEISQTYGGHGFTDISDRELPVFWACGATAQIVAREARLPICITHHKAHMVLTDLPVIAAPSAS
jgi:uncharacterized protein YcsI (UPF0317 family)